MSTLDGRVFALEKSAPTSGREQVPKHFRSVDFPQPDAPTDDWDWPSVQVQLIPENLLAAILLDQVSDFNEPHGRSLSIRGQDMPGIMNASMAMNSMTNSL